VTPKFEQLKAGHFRFKAKDPLLIKNSRDRALFCRLDRESLQTRTVCWRGEFELVDDFVNGQEGISIRQSVGTAGSNLPVAWAASWLGSWDSHPREKNPNLCATCCEKLPPGGVELDIAVLFADVRGSTAIGERLSPSEYASVLNRFYGATTEALIRCDAIIDKLIGDEVMVLFIPGICGPEYQRRAIEAALALRRAVGYGPSGPPWLEIGGAVHWGLLTLETWVARGWLLSPHSATP
jgi:hypothetical protein